MDAHPHDHEDKLGALELRLTGWRPDVDGLNADAMLFAAGLAAGRRNRERLLTLVLCGMLAAVAAGLGVWGLSERAERQSLASRLRQPAPSLSTPVVTGVAPVAEPSYEPSPGDYLSMRRRMEEDPNGFLSLLQTAGPQAPCLPPRQPAILTPRQYDGLPVL